MLDLRQMLKMVTALESEAEFVHINKFFGCERYLCVDVSIHEPVIVILESDS